MLRTELPAMGKAVLAYAGWGLLLVVLGQAAAVAVFMSVSALSGGATPEWLVGLGGLFWLLLITVGGFTFSQVAGARLFLPLVGRLPHYRHCGFEPERLRTSQAVGPAFRASLAMHAGFFLFLLPGYFLLVRIGFAAPEAMVRGGKDAITRSWKLTGGPRFWAVTSVYLLSMAVPAAVVSVLFGFLTLVVWSLASPTNLEALLALALVLGLAVLVAVVLRSLVLLFGACAWARLSQEGSERQGVSGLPTPVQRELEVSASRSGPPSPPTPSGSPLAGGPAAPGPVPTAGGPGSVGRSNSWEEESTGGWEPTSVLDSAQNHPDRARDDEYDGMDDLTRRPQRAQPAHRVPDNGVWGVALTALGQKPIVIRNFALLGRNPTPQPTDPGDTLIVRLADAGFSVSKTHAAIHVDAGTRVIVEDRGSTNGSQVRWRDGQVVESGPGQLTELPDGGVLTLGDLAMSIAHLRNGSTGDVGGPTASPPGGR